MEDFNDIKTWYPCDQTAYDLQKEEYERDKKKLEKIISLNVILLQ